MILYRELIKEKPSLGNLETKTSKSKTMLSKEESFLPLLASLGRGSPSPISCLQMADSLHVCVQISPFCMTPVLLD